MEKREITGISQNQLIERLGKINLNGSYDFKYSNFGMSVVGAVLSKIYNEDYTTLANEFVKSELGLHNTNICDGSGDLGKYWEWAENDAYIPAGALTSTIEDMLQYAQIQLNGKPGCISGTHEVLAEIDASSTSNKKMNIHMDSIGAAWMLDTHNNIIWHNGGTGNYNSYIGFDPETNTAVVLLANLAPGYRIPVTVMGVRLLNDLR